MSHEDNDSEGPHSVPSSHSIQDPVARPLKDSRRSSCEKLDSSDKYVSIMKLPARLKTFKPGNVFSRFRSHRSIRYKTAFQPPKGANIFKLWKWEIFNCVLAIGMLASIFGVLKRYNGQRIPDWGATINLSTLVALLATLLRVFLVYVVAEIIGQAKWEYFAGDGRPTERPPMRRLVETSRFQDASQGSIGAMKLLPTILRDPATLLAVVVMVFSLGTGSFVQQAIQTQHCQFPVDNANASLPISQNLTAGQGGGSSLFGPLDIPNVLAALSSALAPDSEEIGSPISVQCPTGNCTFQNSVSGMYSTLGVCSRCADTSSLITSTGWASITEESTDVYDPEIGFFTATPGRTYFTANYTLPNGMSIQASLDNNTSPQTQSTEFLVSASLGLERGLDWAGDLVGLEMKALAQWAFANVTVLTSNWVPTSSGYTDYIAATCTLYPCLRSYSSSVTLGQLNEVLVNTAPAVPNVAAMFPSNITTEAMQEAMSGLNWDANIYGTDPGARFQAVESPCLVNDTLWTKGNQSLTADMQRLLLLHAEPDANGARNFEVENITVPAECIYGMDIVAWSDFWSFMIDTSFNGSCSAWSSLDGLQKNMQMNCGKAYWLARFYRDDGTTAGSLIKRIEAFTDRLSNKMRMDLLNTPKAVSGQVLQATVCSRVQYSWLTFPAVLVTVTSGLLVWTIFQSSRRRGREMIWKTSILPFLFYGDRFIVQNGEDVSAYSTESPRRNGADEPLLDLKRMETDARQQKVRFHVFD